jgi:hypothetical protein
VNIHKENGRSRRGIATGEVVVKGRVGGHTVRRVHYSTARVIEMSVLNFED